jgi:hypothetical protein
MRMKLTVIVVIVSFVYIFAYSITDRSGENWDPGDPGEHLS